VDRGEVDIAFLYRKAKEKNPMKIIGIEEHFLTSAVRDAWSASSAAERDGGIGLHLGEIEDRLDDLSDARIRKVCRPSDQNPA
jgi:hypothetical protein